LREELVQLNVESLRRTFGGSSVRQSLNRFFAFSLVGAFATGLHYVVLVFLVELLRIAPIVASASAFCFSAACNYLCNYHFTFRSDKKHVNAASKFTVVALVGLVLNTLAMAAILKLLRVHYLWAQVGATGAVLLWTFSANSLWTFRE
jgi:putative flippase GtrA